MTGPVDFDRLDRDARDLAPTYRVAEPFPHAVIRGAFDEDTLRGIAIAAQAEVDTGQTEVKEHAHARKGTVGHNRSWTGDTRAVFHELNSASFVRFLETLTGIEGLIPDPHYLGGGLHMIPPGGWLDVHADFSRHDRLDLDRRLNVIVYLNEGWDPDWGGALELWSCDMSEKVVEVLTGSSPRTVTRSAWISPKSTRAAQPAAHTMRFSSCPRARRRCSVGTFRRASLPSNTPQLANGVRATSSTPPQRRRADGRSS